MIKKVFIDTSAWIAYSLKGEANHERIKELLSGFIKQGVVICTSNDVIDEVVARLVTSTNYSITKGFIDFIEQSIRFGRLVQFWTDEKIQTDGFKLVKKYFEHGISLTDATSMVLMEVYTIDAIISLDSDFRKVGRRSLP